MACKLEARKSQIFNNSRSTWAFGATNFMFVLLCYSASPKAHLLTQILREQKKVSLERFGGILSTHRDKYRKAHLALFYLSPAIAGFHRRDSALLATLISKAIKNPAIMAKCVNIAANPAIKHLG